MLLHNGGSTWEASYRDVEARMKTGRRCEGCRIRRRQSRRVLYLAVVPIERSPQASDDEFARQRIGEQVS